jgi:hypothetical protein
MENLANQNLAELEPERWIELLLYHHPSMGNDWSGGRDSRRGVHEKQTRPQWVGFVFLWSGLRPVQPARHAAEDVGNLWAQQRQDRDDDDCD